MILKESLQIIENIFKDSIIITSFVMVTMLIIEYVSVHSKGNWLKSIRNAGWLQIILSASLGVLPGCFGAFTAVSLYTHGIINFAGLVTAMIAATGDEAFVMLAMIPGSAIKLFIIVFIVAIVVGLILNAFIRKQPKRIISEGHLEVHNDEPEFGLFKTGNILSLYKPISFQRLLLILIGGTFVFGILTNIFQLDSLLEKIVFLTVCFLGLFIIITAPEHFLNEHLWQHIFRKHLLKIFLWTFGALFLIHFLLHYIHIESWIKSNQMIILIIAVLIGIIPESGPHIIFITLFASGSIPFSILIANSIVQDGHGALPLLAESKRSFVSLKLVNVTVGFIAGILGMILGF